MKIEKILRFIYVVQVQSNKERVRKGLRHLGRGYSEAKRLNPYNPLSYLTLLIILIVCLIMFGVVGFKKELDITNPFNWH